MSIPAPLKGLLLSRKFWLAAIGAIVAAVLYIQESITADALVDAILVLIITVAAGITIEDAAEKHSQSTKPAAPGSGQMMVGGDATIIHEAEAAPVEVVEAVEVVEVAEAVRGSAVPESTAGGGG